MYIALLHIPFVFVFFLFLFYLLYVCFPPFPLLSFSFLPSLCFVLLPLVPISFSLSCRSRCAFPTSSQFLFCPSVLLPTFPSLPSLFLFALRQLFQTFLFPFSIQSLPLLFIHHLLYCLIHSFSFILLLFLLFFNAIKRLPFFSIIFFFLPFYRLSYPLFILSFPSVFYLVSSVFRLLSSICFIPSSSSSFFFILLFVSSPSSVQSSVFCT